MTFTKQELKYLQYFVNSSRKHSMQELIELRENDPETFRWRLDIENRWFKWIKSVYELDEVIDKQLYENHKKWPEAKRIIDIIKYEGD